MQLMLDSRTDMVVERRHENLRFVPEPAEWPRVDDPGVVALEIRAEVALARPVLTMSCAFV
jgi:hypothetical protein